MTCELCGGTGLIQWWMRLGCVEPAGWEDIPGEPAGDETLLGFEECPACNGTRSVRVCIAD